MPAALAGLYGLALNMTQPPEGGTAFAYRGRTWWCALRPRISTYETFSTCKGHNNVAFVFQLHSHCGPHRLRSAWA